MPGTVMDSPRPTLGHVNLMLDTFLANATVNDLRAIVRSTLATSPPSTSASFIESARKRLQQTYAKVPVASKGLFVTLENGYSIPGPALQDTLSATRSLYGAGMGIISLQKFAEVIRATIGHRWDEDSELEAMLAVIDADIAQAIQSSKEELLRDNPGDRADAIAAVAQLTSVIEESRVDIQRWDGDFPFERAADSLRYLVL
ncbi:unnamed protein product [Somion occarium]|uniref:Uncharacterized protein n=1 Tax=Somion occarium TaxID=3059160 RepID=A0ABP1DJ98_9APHY